MIATSFVEQSELNELSERFSQEFLELVRVHSYKGWMAVQSMVPLSAEAMPFLIRSFALTLLSELHINETIDINPDYFKSVELGERVDGEQIALPPVEPELPFTD